MNRPASELLHLMMHHMKTDTISLRQIKEALHERGFGLLMVLFVIPCCLPIPVPPGVPFIFSIPLLFLSLQMIAGRSDPWLPEWLAKKSFKRSSLAYMVEKAAPILQRIEVLLRPRWSFASKPRGERIVGLVIFLLAFVIALPLPIPFSNFIPGIGILVMSLGLLGKDGVIIVLGMLIGSFGASLLLGVLMFGVKVIDGFISKFIA